MGSLSLGTGIWAGGPFVQQGYTQQNMHDLTIKIMNFKKSGSDFTGRLCSILVIVY